MDGKKVIGKERKGQESKLGEIKYKNWVTNEE